MASNQNSRSEKVRIMFDSIAKNYDLANDLMSLFVDRWWYRKLMKISSPASNADILDCACGTGTMTFHFKEKFPSAKLTGVDYSSGMLEIAKHRASDKNLDAAFVESDVLNMPFADNSFDLSTICYGIRNVVSVTSCLNEMARVVRPGGKVCILEFGMPTGIMKIIYKIYHTVFVQPVGALLTQNKQAYSYLTNTIANFPCAGDFTDIMKSTGCFSSASFKKLTFGIAYIYSGIVK